MLAMEPRVVDAVWSAIQAHLPPRPPETHPLGLSPTAHPGP